MVWIQQEFVVIWLIDLSLASQLRASPARLLPCGVTSEYTGHATTSCHVSTWPGERSSTHATNMRGGVAVFAPGLQAVRTRSCGLETDLSALYMCARFLGLASRSSACSFLPSLALGRDALLQHRTTEAPFLAALDPQRREPMRSLALCPGPVDSWQVLSLCHSNAASTAGALLSRSRHAQGEIRPILFPTCSLNQRLPSGPRVIANGAQALPQWVGRANS